MKTIKQSIVAILVIAIIALVGLYGMHDSMSISMMDESVLNNVLGGAILVSLISCIGIYSLNNREEDEDNLQDYYDRY